MPDTPDTPATSNTKNMRPMMGAATFCVECGRIFEILTNEVDAAEWAHGHDCET